MKQTHIRKNALLTSLWTLLSRFVGIVRGFLQLRVLGVGIWSDAFIYAIELPHFLRKVCADGALSAAVVPSLTRLTQRGEWGRGRATVDTLLTGIFIVGLLMSLFVIVWPHLLITVIAPGLSAEQALSVAQLLPILIPYGVFLFGGALCASALHGAGYAWAQPFSNTLLNMVYLGALLLVGASSGSVIALAYGILAGGVFYCGFTYAWYRIVFRDRSVPAHTPVNQIIHHMMRRFPVALFGAGGLEILAWINAMSASCLPSGSLTLIHYAHRFAGIPLGIIGGACAAALLPYFSFLSEQHSSQWREKRYSYVLTTMCGALFWGLGAASFYFVLFAEDIFTLFFSGLGAHSAEAAVLLQIYAAGFVACGVQKILLSLLYALDDRSGPFWAMIIAMGVTIGGNVLSVAIQSPRGIVCSTVLGVICSVLFLFSYLKRVYNYRLLMPFLRFHVLTASIQIITFGSCLTLVAFLWRTACQMHEVSSLLLNLLFLIGAGGLYAALLFTTRRFFNVRLYFLS